MKSHKPETENAPHTNDETLAGFEVFMNDETLAAVSKALADLATEKLTLEELEELDRTAWRVKWTEKMKEISTSLSEKYPDLVALVAVPPEEWLTRYPTIEALDALGERIAAMQREFGDLLTDLVTEMPAPVRAQLSAATKALLQEIWNTPGGEEAIENMEKDGLF